MFGLSSGILHSRLAPTGSLKYVSCVCSYIYAVSVPALYIVHDLRWFCGKSIVLTVVVNVSCFIGNLYHLFHCMEKKVSVSCAVLVCFLVLDVGIVRLLLILP